MRKNFLIVASFLLISCILCIMPAHAQVFTEDFDSYTNGSQMHGQGGWKGWDNDPLLGALVTNTYFHSSPNSVDIAGTSDLVHEFSGINQGIVTFTAWQYIPSNFSGATYFILLNTYTDSGPNNNWSTQISFDSNTGLVDSEFDNNTLPLIYGQWVQIRVVIDFTADTQDIYYNNQLLVSKSWTDGVSGGGALNLAAVDLWANSSTSVYYDDIEIHLASATPIPTINEWGMIIFSLLLGTVAVWYIRKKGDYGRMA